MTIEARNFDQLIMTTIISSFVHHNRFGQSNRKQRTNNSALVSVQFSFVTSHSVSCSPWELEYTEDSFQIAL